MATQADLTFDLDPNTDLDAIMKTLEEDLPNCSQLVQEEFFDHAGVNTCRDKTESVSSDCSLSSYSFESDGSTSPTEAPKISTSHASEGESGDQTAGRNSNSKHGMVTRRRGDRPDYNLRNSSIMNRIQTEQRRNEPKKPKPKAKPPPLSKYRRRTANSRERSRMQQINDAFEVLRKAIPSYSGDEHAKLTKITTLRLAMNYIMALRDMLGYSNEGYDGCESGSDLGSSANSDIACASPDSLPVPDHQVVSPAGLSDGSERTHTSSSALEETLEELGLFDSDTLRS